LLSRSHNSTYETFICCLGKDKIPNKALKSVDTIFHLAGLAHDIKNNKDESFYHLINFEATVELARLAVKNNIKNFVFVSSVKAGGMLPSNRCLFEEDQGTPEGIYGRTKREAEIELLKIGKKSNMNISIIRPSLVYGPNLKGNLNLMFLGIKQGWFPPLPETGNQRSMIHVDDLSRAILFLSTDDRANGEIFIATDGQNYSSREIYNIMCILLSKPIPKWEVPKILFSFIGFFSAKLKYKINKLLDDELYSSAKLEALGFKSNKTLSEMNETNF